VSQSFNLATWLRRLGYKRQDEPEFIYAVQPVQVLSNVETLTPLLKGASVMCGGLMNQVAGQFGYAEFSTTSPGGSILHHISVSGSGVSAPCEYGFVQVPLVYDTFTGIAVNHVETGVPGIVCRLGALTPSPFTTALSAPRIPGNTILDFPRGMFLSPDQLFVIGLINSNVAWNVGAAWTDLPAPRGD